MMVANVIYQIKFLVVLMVVALLVQSDGSQGAVTSVKYTALCAENVTLREPNLLLRIHFDVPDRIPADDGDDGQPCTSYIRWDGPPGFHLVPHVVETGPNTPKDQQQIVLSIRDVSGTMFELNMFGPKAFYLAMIPAKLLGTGEPCPWQYFFCGSQYCIHEELVCDGLVHCHVNKARCHDSPSAYFIISTFMGVIMLCLLVAITLTMFIYCRFYRKSKQDSLMSEYKPTMYGSLNDSFEFVAVADHDQKFHKFYQNIQHYRDHLAVSKS